MTVSTVPITQINLYHSKGASAILAKSTAAMHTHLAIIQEPWLLNNAIKGLGGCRTIFRACSNRKLRTCLVAKDLNITFLPQLSSEDLTVVQTSINLEEGKTMDLLIGSAYMLYDSCDPPSQDNVKNLVAHAEEAGLELLLGCDANSHHVGWGSSNINPRGESLHDFILGKGLIILNRVTEPTFMDARRQEIIDITICTKGVFELIGDWKVLDEPSGSDHRQIRLTLRQQPTNSWRRNPRKTN